MIEANAGITGAHHDNGWSFAFCATTPTTATFGGVILFIYSRHSFSPVIWPVGELRLASLFRPHEKHAGVLVTNIENRNTGNHR